MSLLKTKDTITKELNNIVCSIFQLKVGKFGMANMKAVSIVAFGTTVAALIVAIVSLSTDYWSEADSLVCLFNSYVN